MNVIEKLLELPLQHDDRLYHSEPDLIDTRTSACQYDPIIQSIELGRSKFYKSIVGKWLSLGPPRKASFSRVDRVHLFMDDDVETISMLWAQKADTAKTQSMSTLFERCVSRTSLRPGSLFAAAIQE